MLEHTLNKKIEKVFLIYLIVIGCGVYFTYLFKYMFIVGQTLSGAEFNKINTEKYFKLTNESEIHNNLQFKDGLNVDFLPFNPNGQCSKGGIYITLKQNIGMWCIYGSSTMKYYREVTIPDDAQVYIENNKVKVDKLILSKRKELWKEEEICKLAVQQYGSALQFVKNQTEDICKLAVQQDGYVLQYVKNQTEEICKLAVQQNGWALYYVKNQTEEICKLAGQRQHDTTCK